MSEAPQTVWKVCCSARVRRPVRGLLIGYLCRAVSLKHASETEGGEVDLKHVLAWVREPEPPGVSGPQGAGGRYEGLVTALQNLAERQPGIAVAADEGTLRNSGLPPPQRAGRPEAEGTALTDGVV